MELERMEMTLDLFLEFDDRNSHVKRASRTAVDLETAVNLQIPPEVMW